MDALLEKLVEENRPFTREGRVAGYIPELAKADRDELGICVVSSDGRISSAGEYRRTFTIQSIIKPILLLLALMDNGEDTVRARVGVEATGKPLTPSTIRTRPCSASISIPWSTWEPSCCAP